MLVIAGIVVAGFWFFYRPPVAALVPPLSKTYTNATFGFALQMPADFSAYPPDAAATATTAGEALVLGNPAGDAVQIEITNAPYAHPTNTLTPADMSRLSPSFTPTDPQPIAITPAVTGMVFTDPSGAYGNSSDVLFFYQNNLYTITTSVRLLPLVEAMVATWRFTH